MGITIGLNVTPMFYLAPGDASGRTAELKYRSYSLHRRPATSRNTMGRLSDRRSWPPSPVPTDSPVAGTYGIADRYSLAGG